MHGVSSTRSGARCVLGLRSPFALNMSPHSCRSFGHPGVPPHAPANPYTHHTRHLTDSICDVSNGTVRVLKLACQIFVTLVQARDVRSSFCSYACVATVYAATSSPNRLVDLHSLASSLRLPCDLPAASEPIRKMHHPRVSAYISRRCPPARFSNLWPAMAWYEYSQPRRRYTQLSYRILVATLCDDPRAACNVRTSQHNASGFPLPSLRTPCDLVAVLKC